jgi:type II secretory pathway pseudopilin PulG
MDATRTPLHFKVVIILSALLLAAVPGFAAGSLNANGVASATVALNGASTSAIVSVTSTGDPIAFTESTTYTDGASGPQNWLSAIPSGTTPATIYVSM